MRELRKDEFKKCLVLLKNIPFNTLFAKGVLDGTVEGRVFVDDVENLKTAYILHSYSMSLLCGEYNENFFYDLIQYFNGINKNEMVQFYPCYWERAFNGLEKNKIKKFRRFNLILNIDKYNDSLNDMNLNNYKVIKATKEDLTEFKGVVVPKYFWNYESIYKCQAFIVLNGEEQVAIAFSSAIDGNIIEIGVETKEEYRRKGLVTVATKALINYCLENGYKPIWACKNDNYSSINLANKLGFEKIYEGPYYEIISK